MNVDRKSQSAWSSECPHWTQRHNLCWIMSLRVLRLSQLTVTLCLINLKDNCSNSSMLFQLHLSCKAIWLQRRKAFQLLQTRQKSHEKWQIGHKWHLTSCSACTCSPSHLTACHNWGYWRKADPSLPSNSLGAEQENQAQRLHWLEAACPKM